MVGKVSRVSKFSVFGGRRVGFGAKNKFSGKQADVVRFAAYGSGAKGLVTWKRSEYRGKESGSGGEDRRGNGEGVMVTGTLM